MQTYTHTPPITQQIQLQLTDDWVVSLPSRKGGADRSRIKALQVANCAVKTLMSGTGWKIQYKTMFTQSIPYIEAVNYNWFYVLRIRFCKATSALISDHCPARASHSWGSERSNCPEWWGQTAASFSFLPCPTVSPNKVRQSLPTHTIIVLIHVTYI